MSKNKYHAKPVVVDGVRFDSQREARRYGELRLLLELGVITDLEIHPRYPLVVNGVLVATYVGDFQYFEGEVMVLEDCKGFRTPLYRLKKKLMRALYSIEIKET